MSRPPRNEVARSLPGFRASRVIKSLEVFGEIWLWDTHLECPKSVVPGPDLERWVLQHRTAKSRKKFPMVWIPRLADAKLAMGQLVKGIDNVGLFSLGNPENEGYVANPETPPPGGGQAEITVAETSPRIQHNDLTSALKAKFSFDEICTVLDGMINAERTVSFGGKGENTITEPDWATRKEGIRLILAYMEGQPIARKEVLRRNENRDGDVMAKLMMRPGYRHAVKNFIAKVDQDHAAKLQQLRDDAEEIEIETEEQ